MPKRRYRAGFTLVELLVVIGIIAVLISMLLPALNRAREQSRQTVCTSNLRQVGMAFMSYAQDNRDVLPSPASSAIEQAQDWVWWEPDRIQHVGRGGIGPYLSLSYPPGALAAGADDRASVVQSLAVLRCPSDVYEAHPSGKYNRYPFSYSMNGALTVKSSTTYAGGVGTGISLGMVLNPSGKILLIEEDENTINDGDAALMGPSVIGGSNPSLLGIRHDLTRREPDTVANALTMNGSCRGNVAFCDGHVEYRERSYVQNMLQYLPNQ
jgi:prepilin-type N-terminal cleavage/methylation domain-containing protein/prepilin-type processing-associated H-X9-DG protein